MEYIDAVSNAFFSNPLYYLGLVLAFWAAIGFLTFLRGFLSGAPHLFTYDGHDEFLPGHRLRTMWGPAIMMTAWGLWELLRWLAGIFEGTYDAVSFWIWFLLLACVWIPWVMLGWKKLKGK